MSESQEPQYIKVGSVCDIELHARAAKDLQDSLPAGTYFVVDVKTFVDYDVWVQRDRTVYIVTLCIFVGMDDAKYSNAIRYAIDLIQGDLSWHSPVFTSPHIEASTNFPSIDNINQPQLVAVGATADIYRAIDRLIHREVAVKVFKVFKDCEDMAINAAVAEASKLAVIDNYAVPKLLSSGGLTSGSEVKPYLVIEWCQGQMPSSGNSEEFGLADVKALGRLFGSVVCVPPIPLYVEAVNNVSSIHEMLAILSSLPLLPSPVNFSVDSNYFSKHAWQWHARRSEWIHLFQQHFDIRTRIILQCNSTAKKSFQVEYDKTTHWAMIICGSEYNFISEFKDFCREMLRIFLRDWTFEQHYRFSQKPRGYGELSQGDRSQALEAGRGLSLEQMQEGLNKMVEWSNDLEVQKIIASEDEDRLTEIFSRQVSEMNESDPARSKVFGLLTYAQLLIAGRSVETLCMMAAKGKFRNLMDEQISSLDELKAVYGVFADGGVIELLKNMADFLGRELSSSETELLSEIKTRRLSVLDWSVSSFAVLVEGLSSLLSPCEEQFLMVPTVGDHPQINLHKYGVYKLSEAASPLRLTYYEENISHKELIINEPDYDVINLAAVVMFEKIARGTSSESFYCGQFSIHGRLNIGNILGIDDYYGIFQGDEWDKLFRIVISQVLQKRGGHESLKMRLRELFEGFVSDLHSACYDGRISVDHQLSSECNLMLRSLGFITLCNFRNMPNSTFMDQWVEEHIDLVRSEILEEGKLGLFNSKRYES